MMVQVLAFGIAKEIFGKENFVLDLKEEANVGELRLELEQKYPRLKQLASYMIAMGNEYAENTDKIISGKELAIIPPVSGG